MENRTTARRKPRFIIAVTTIGSLSEARRLAQGILRNRLAGCINLIPQIHSWYWWRGKQEKAREILVLLKTERRQLAALDRFLKAHHPYEVPELIALPILWGTRVYLKWLEQNISSKRSPDGML
jgi:periplasmic divalent cation tolerance protein